MPHRARRRALLAFGISFALAGAALGALTGYADQDEPLRAAEDAGLAQAGWTQAPVLAFAIVSGMAGLVLGLAGVRGPGRQ